MRSIFVFEFLDCFDINLLCSCRWWIIKPRDTEVKSITFNITFLAIERGFDFISVFSCPGGVCTEVARFSDHDSTIITKKNSKNDQMKVRHSSLLPTHDLLILFYLNSQQLSRECSICHALPLSCWPSCRSELSILVLPFQTRLPRCAKFISLVSHLLCIIGYFCAID